METEFFDFAARHVARWRSRERRIRMAKAQTRPATRTARSTPAQPAPQPAPAAPVARPRNDRLTPQDVNRTGTNVKLTGVFRIYRGDRDVSIIAELQVGKGAPASGQYRDMFLTIGRPDYIAVERQLGKDLGQWGGQVLSVEISRDGQYVNIYNPDRPQPGAAPTRASAPVDDDDLPF